MASVLLRRILVSLPTLLGVTIIAFMLVRLIPGDPVLLLLGERGGSPEVYARLQAKLGLDKPVIEQYFIFLKNAISGDLGTSILSKRSVWSEFMDRFPATLELGFSGLLFAIIFGIPFGILAALKRNTVLDYSIMTTSLVGYSMPIFWWGLILILIFSIGLGWTPVSGRLSVMYDIDAVTGFYLIDSLLSDDGVEAFWSTLKHLILPAVALGTIPLAVIARMTRSSMLEVLGEDYMRTAKAKGLSRFRIVLVHGLRNALVPVVTVIGLMVGSIITGAILTETIFSWPGIGRWLVQSVTSRDYPVVQGGVLCIATLVILVNLVVDIINIWVDPRQRS